MRLMAKCYRGLKPASIWEWVDRAHVAVPAV